MLLRLRVLAAGLGLVAGLFTAQVGAVADEPPLPSSMAATGDSITRAFDVNGSCLLRDCPQYSWATGDRPEVSSQYLRILAGNPDIAGQAYNDAVTGARMDDLDRQLNVAAGQGVEYVTIAIGANDVCTHSIPEMTAPETVSSQLRQALDDFTATDPGALIYLSSIPNVYQLWSILHGNPSARFVWAAFQICQSMLSNGNSESDRQAVLARIVADNDALAEVCSQYVSCLWDGLAAFNFAFTPADVSTVDYFHPSVQGQARIAALTWAVGYWPSR